MPIFAKKFLGIDIGTSALKIVELSKKRGRIFLENYGEIRAEAFYAKTFRTFERSVLSLSRDDIAQAIRAIIKESKIKTKKCVFTIPDFTTFFTTFELPPMLKEELPQAVKFEARQYVPLPIAEVVLDWKVIEGVLVGKEKTKLKILLVAVPKELINQYQEIAELAGLDLTLLEAEVFGLVKSLIPEEEKRVISIVDIGSQSTTCSIVDKRILKISHSFDFSADQLTEKIAKGLSIGYSVAESLKKKYGILKSSAPALEGRADVRKMLLPLINMLLREIESIINGFYSMEGKKVQKIILAGGTALLPGLLEYFRDYFKMEVEIANPFLKIFYPPILEEKIKEMGPSYAIAIGAALEGLE